VISNRSEQYQEAVSNIFNLLESRRKDLALVKQELQEFTKELTNEDLEPDDEEKLFAKVRDRRAIQKKHINEISKLEAQTTVEVNYRVVKTGLSAVLPPGLIVHPDFLPEPVCWCPHKIPVCTPVEETTSENERLPLVNAEQLTAAGRGLKHYFHEQPAKFAITTKDSGGQLPDVSLVDLVVESKETELRFSCLQIKKGTYEASYSADIEEEKQFSLAVTYLGTHIRGSPFSVEAWPLLLEFASSEKHTSDWLDAAVRKLSNVPRARLKVYLCDESGLEVYCATGETSCRWTQYNITSSASTQWREGSHPNAIQFDNGDRMMIVGKNRGCDAHNYNDCEYDQFRSCNIIINKGSGATGWRQTRRLIIALSAPNVQDWTAPGNLISFASEGWSTGSNWPKFTGTFRIYYKAA